MSGGYFDNFPNLYYSLDPNNIEFKGVVNIFARVKFLDTIINNISLFFSYDVRDGDTPQNMAYKLYGDATRSWMILFVNQILDPYFQWIMNDAEFQQNVIDQYGSIANSQITLDHIEKQTITLTTYNYVQNVSIQTSYIDPANTLSIDGFTTFPTIADPVIQIGSNTIVQFADGSVVDQSVILTANNAYDTLLNLNESRRSIKLVKPEYADQIEQELKNLLAQ